MNSNHHYDATDQYVTADIFASTQSHHITSHHNPEPETNADAQSESEVVTRNQQRPRWNHQRPSKLTNKGTRQVVNPCSGQRVIILPRAVNAEFHTLEVWH